MEPIDFTQWTDAQLDSAKHLPSVHSVELNQEIERRINAGIWRQDGSHERVAALLGRPRRRKVRH